MNPIPTPGDAVNRPIKPKPQTRPLPASLREFLFAPAAPAKRFIAQALRKQMPRLDGGEMESLVRDVANSPAALTKLAQAIAELTSPDSLIAQELAEIAERVCRTRVLVTVTIPPLTLGTSLDDLRRAVAGMGNVRADKPGRSAREQLVHFLLAAAWIKGAIGGPTLADILLALETRKISVGENSERELAALLVRNLNKPGPRAEALTVYVLQQATLATALQEKQSLVETNLRLQAQADELTAKIRELETQCSVATSTAQERDAQIGRLTRDLADQQAVARQSRRALRARFNGLLQGEFSSLVRDAQAAVMEPVRPHIISDRLESLADIIKKETSWLESSE